MGGKESANVCCICGAECPHTPPSRTAGNRIVCAGCSAKGLRPPRTDESVDEQTTVRDDGMIALEGIEDSTLDAIIESQKHEPAPLATRQKVGHRTGAEASCPNCAYDLSGLTCDPGGRPTVTCPECGCEALMASGRSRKQALSDAEFAVDQRRQYIRAGVMLGAGVLAVCIIRLAMGDLSLLKGDLIRWCIAAGVGGSVFWICGLAFVGFDAPASLTMLRLCGLYAVLMAFLAFFFPAVACPMAVPTCMYYFAVPSMAVALHAYILHNVMELELVDSGFVTMLGCLAVIGAWILANSIGLL